MNERNSWIFPSKMANVYEERKYKKLKWQTSGPVREVCKGNTESSGYTITAAVGMQTSAPSIPVSNVQEFPAQEKYKKH